MEEKNTPNPENKLLGQVNMVMNHFNWRDTYAVRQLTDYTDTRTLKELQEHVREMLEMTAKEKRTVRDSNFYTFVNEEGNLSLQYVLAECEGDEIPF